METVYLANHLKRSVNGPMWHGPALAELLEGVTHAQAAARPIGGAHTIWELVLHVTAWAEIARARLKGERLEDPTQQQDWPPVQDASASAWTDAVERLRTAHQALAQDARRIDDAVLHEKIPGLEYSRSNLLHGVIEHDTYHGGQIAVLKKALAGQGMMQSDPHVQSTASARPAVIRIERATERDLQTVLQMIGALAEYERMADQVVATESDLREALFAAKPDAEVLIAYADDAPAGFALFFHNFSTFVGRRGLYLEDLFVKPELRGAGIGKRLLAELARIAIERGCGRFEWAVLDWNEPAIGFYKKLGAAPMHDWTVFRLTGEALASLAATKT